MSDPIGCVKCKAVSSIVWHRGEDGGVVCHSCQPSDAEKCNSETSSQLSGHCQGTGGGNKGKPKEKASKAKQGKGSNKNGGGMQQQGSARAQQKGRRTLVKQKPVRASKDENSTCSVVTSDSITYKVHLLTLSEESLCLETLYL